MKRLRELSAELRNYPERQLKAAISHADSYAEASALAELLPR